MKSGKDERHEMMKKLHRKFMKSVMDLKRCDEGKDLNAEECCEKHIEDMEKTSGNRKENGPVTNVKNHFNNGLPTDVQKFLQCFETLKTCMVNLDEKSVKTCTDQMIECTGVKNGSPKGTCEDMNRMKKMGMLKHAQRPLLKSIKEYRQCSCKCVGMADAGEKETCNVKCTNNHIKKVQDLMNWSRLGRCQSKSFLCSIDGKSSCMDEVKSCVSPDTNMPNDLPTDLTGMCDGKSEKKSIDNRQKKRGMKGMNKMMRGKMGRHHKKMTCEEEKDLLEKKFATMNAAKVCLTTALSCTDGESCHTDYTKCAKNSGHVNMIGKHLQCYSMMKNMENHDSECIKMYLGCLGMGEDGKMTMKMPM